MGRHLDDDPEGVEWIRRATDENTRLELGNIKRLAENWDRLGELVLRFEDSIRIVGNYADVIVLRHHEEGAAKRAAAVSSVPIINAGDGPGQHPTQALLDLYTIQRELRAIDGISIAMVGDLKHGRTVRSLAYLLGRYKNVRIFFVSPKELTIGSDIQQYLHRHPVY